MSFAPPRHGYTIAVPPRRGQLHVTQTTLTDSMFPRITTSAVESNQACKSFHCQPPSLEVYLAGLPGSSPINEADYASDDDVLNFFADESDMSSENESSD
ncbi:hypothetical protein PF001_g1632 [Phytophthora fragariae]|uniref:Uncharacterized protein n=1 Tax=Phytophthora fragariae TaxID=53985 RepID=A0A6A4EKY9_9STRA|nr:hypothetical protein PF001_g1632 [Phytophthora fragariae]